MAFSVYSQGYATFTTLLSQLYWAICSTVEDVQCDDFRHKPVVLFSGFFCFHWGSTGLHGCILEAEGLPLFMCYCCRLASIEEPIVLHPSPFSHPSPSTPQIAHFCNQFSRISFLFGFIWPFIWFLWIPLTGDTVRYLSFSFCFLLA